LVVVGAGPAGLTAAFEATRAGWQVTVLEKDPDYVGGISRTVRNNGYRFDIGGHRFFSKSSEITRWWQERLPDDFIQVHRMSRIY
jgi:protoporphyrinogen oxidase